MPDDTSLVLAKVESVPGTYANPAPATDAFIVFNYEVQPMESETVRREIERGFNGINPSVPTAIRNRHTYSVELSGSGVKDAPAKWGSLLRASQFGAPVVSAGVEVTYPLVGNGDGESLSIAGIKGNEARHRSNFARGNVTIAFNERALPSIRFEHMGVIEGGSPADYFVPAGLVLPEYPAPVEVSLVNTVITLDGLVLGVRSFELSLGAKTEYFSTTGRRAIFFGKDAEGNRRSPTATCVFEMPSLAVKNYFDAIIAGTEVPFSLVHGTVEGNIVELSSQHAKLGSATYTAEQGRLFLNCPLEFVATAAGNDFILKTR